MNVPSISDKPLNLPIKHLNLIRQKIPLSKISEQPLLGVFKANLHEKTLAPLIQSAKMTAGKTLMMYEIEPKIDLKTHQNLNPHKKKITKPKNSMPELHQETHSTPPDFESSIFSSSVMDEDLDGKRTPTTVSSFEMLSSSATPPSRSGSNSPKQDGGQCEDSLMKLKNLMEEASQEDPKGEGSVVKDVDYRTLRDEICKNEEKDFEISKLRFELENQIKLNGEMKNLLVASLGGTLVPKLEKLIEEKCKVESDNQFAMNSMSRHSDMMDNFGALCRSYQTKYLAARMMAKHLNATKAEIKRIYTRIDRLLESTLAERKIIADHMIQTLNNLSPLVPLGETSKFTELTALSSNVVRMSQLIVSTHPQPGTRKSTEGQVTYDTSEETSLDTEIRNLLSELKAVIVKDLDQDSSKTHDRTFKVDDLKSTPKEKIIPLKDGTKRDLPPVGQIKVV